MSSLAASLAGGFVGTLVLTTILRAASELRVTRIDLPFLLGTAVSDDRTRAKAIGYLMHFVAGLVFAAVYHVTFQSLDRAGPALGALFGLVHALFAGTALVNVLLPVVHPRMGHDLSNAASTPLLEPPGFMMRNYGVSTPLVSMAAHIAYGAIVGAFASTSA